MMNKRINFTRIFMLMLVFSTFSCDKNPISSTGDVKVDGKIYYNGQAVANATVALKKESAIVQQTSSDLNGAFEFYAVEKGDYTLTYVKKFADSSFVENSSEISVNKNTSYDHLLLPKTVQLYTPLEITNTAITLHWSKFASDNFYEYRLYRHNKPAVDDNVGDLVYISTNVNDTTYFDDLSWDGYLSRNTTVYYRLYVNNQFDKMSGSNILEATTKKWMNEENFTAVYNLSTLYNIGGFAGQIVGIDYNGENLFIVTVQKRGGFYDPNIVLLYKYDIGQRSIVSQFEYIDEYIPPSGMVYAENSLWIGYDAGGGHNPKIKKIDPVSGQVLQELSMTYGVEDMAYDGENFLFCYYYNKIEQVQPNSFSLIQDFSNPFGGGADFGITCRPGEIWLTSRGDNQIAILDPAGNQIGYANTNELTSWNDNEPRLCFADDKLVLVKSPRIYILEISTAD